MLSLLNFQSNSYIPRILSWPEYIIAGYDNWAEYKYKNGALIGVSFSFIISEFYHGSIISAAYVKYVTFVHIINQKFTLFNLFK